MAFMNRGVDRPAFERRAFYFNWLFDRPAFESLVVYLNWGSIDWNLKDVWLI